MMCLFGLCRYAICRIILLIGFLSTIGSSAYSQDESNNTFGKGIQLVASDSSFSMKFGLRFQSLYQGSLNVVTDKWNDQFLIRRARLKFEGFAYDPSLSYKVELGLSSRDISGGDLDQHGNTSRIILDAVLKWQFRENWSLWAGQTKLPGNRERVISSQKMQFVDRSLLNSRFNIDRDIGIQLHHSSKIGNQAVFQQILSVSMGEGRDITTNNIGGYDYTLRLEYLPFGEFTGGGDYFGSDLKREKSPKLAIGVAFDYNDGAARQRGQLGAFVQGSNGNQLSTDLSTLFIDTHFKYKGFSFMGEYANKQSSEQVFVVLDDFSTLKYATGNAVNLQAGYLVDKSEWAIRYTQVNSDDLAYSSLKEETQYTLGYSRYIVGHSLKLQSDLSYSDKALGDNLVTFRVQFEISF
ncbi:porin [Roseivirga echinicomitans]|uniref:porin n=1 Tax=Roseivirga echinicomitans TaxID=296218 RepID=UPI000A91D5C0|nr:porin [Roseivirga echinicomitans]